MRERIRDKFVSIGVSRILRAVGMVAFCVLSTTTGPASAEVQPTLTVLHSFSGSDGAQALDSLVADSSGNLYGTAFDNGGSGGGGTVFKLAPGGAYTVLHSFSGSDGDGPRQLVVDSAGNLYGTTNGGGAFGAGVAFKITPSGTFTVLHMFCGDPPNCNDGAFPSVGLITDNAGNLYGTTSAGGRSNYGTVFELSPDGAFKTLHAFGGEDGAHPTADLIADRTGNLYGTTRHGGVADSGVVFQLARNRTFRVLHHFNGSTDGAGPEAGLIADAAGNLYGTTNNGGVLRCFGAGCGTLFQLSRNGTFTVLHTFCINQPDCRDGARPFDRLIADKAGNLYGTTLWGGSSPCDGYGCGVVFKLTLDGTYTVLHSFSGSQSDRYSDGYFPFAGLIADSAGNLYGTTSGGGTTGNGTVFKLAGTGFVTPTPFAFFKPKLEIDLGVKPNRDSLELSSSFILSPKSEGIDPATEQMNLQVGPVSATLPPGSFEVDPWGRGFRFEGAIDGMHLVALLERTGSLRYAFRAEAKGARLAGTTNPVPVTLTIGDDSGAASVEADIDPRHLGSGERVSR